MNPPMARAAIVAVLSLLLLSAVYAKPASHGHGHGHQAQPRYRPRAPHTATKPVTVDELRKALNLPPRQPRVWPRAAQPAPVPAPAPAPRVMPVQRPAQQFAQHPAQRPMIHPAQQPRPVHPRPDPAAIAAAAAATTAAAAAAAAVMEGEPMIVKKKLAQARQVSRGLRSAYKDKSVLFVGTSTHLAPNLGPLIDSFDVVVRIDLSPTEGYESHVGSKTTHMCMGSINAVCQDRRADKCTPEETVAFWKSMQGKRLMMPSFTTLPDFLNRLNWWQPKTIDVDEIECFPKSPHVIDMYLRENADKDGRVPSPGLHPGNTVVPTSLCCLFSFLLADLVPYITGYDLACIPAPGVPCVAKDHSRDYAREAEVMRQLVDTKRVRLLEHDTVDPLPSGTGAFWYKDPDQVRKEHDRLEAERAQRLIEEAAAVAAMKDALEAVEKSNVTAASDEKGIHMDKKTVIHAISWVALVVVLATAWFVAGHYVSRPRVVLQLK